jgi:hypothetical protein
MLAFADQIEDARLWRFRNVLSDSSPIGGRTAAKLGPDGGQPVEQGAH